ncbi:hypothetical protein [Streptomyces phage phiScoe54]|nr:hypothetical protein [Streptomyces phage phiScoe54]
MSWEEHARKVVDSWPPLTEQDNRELTDLALLHAARHRAPVAA